MNNRDSSSHMFKFILIGDTGVGKSSLMLRFTDDSYTDSFITTIGVDFRIKTMNINDKIVKIQIWDTAGQERFMAITPAYYKCADGIMLCYDITNMSTFENVEKWLAEIQTYNNNNAVRMLVGNKADLENHRKVDSKLVKDFAEKHNMYFMETSAKSCINVDEAFLAMIKELMKTDRKKAPMCLEPVKTNTTTSSCCDKM